MDRLHVATFNILNLADRWPERLPLILADMAALQPDLLGLQEVVYVMQQDRLIGAAGEGQLRGDPRVGRPAGVRQQPARPGAAGRPGTSTGSTSDCSARPIGRVIDLPGGSAGPRGGDPPPPRGAATPPSATARPPRLLDWLASGPDDRRDDRDGRLQRRPRRAGVRPDGRGGLPLGLRRGQRRGARR